MQVQGPFKDEEEVNDKVMRVSSLIDEKQMNFAVVYLALPVVEMDPGYLPELGEQRKKGEAKLFDTNFVDTIHSLKELSPTTSPLYPSTSNCQHPSKKPDSASVGHPSFRSSSFFGLDFCTLSLAQRLATRPRSICHTV